MAAGIVSDALETASSLFGGLFSGAAQVGEKVRSTRWEQAHDIAFEKAIEEAKPNFVQCRRCGQWVCREVCWNQERGLCKVCAPELEAEYTAAQVEAAVAEAKEKAAQVEYVSKEKFEESLVATCPKCGAAASGGKFCSECGAPLRPGRFCAQCGEKIAIGAKFCPQCGAKQ